MEKLLVHALQQLECTSKEIKLYLANFSLGPAKVTDVAKKARLQRSTAYLLSDQLIERGILEDDARAYGKLVRAASPDTLLRLLEAKRRRIGRSSIAISDNLAELRSLHEATSVIPKISTYSGINGLRTARTHILSATSEILLWTNQEAERNIFSPSEHHAFIQERIKKSLHTRVLALDNPDGRSLCASDDATLRRTRLVPATHTFTTETYLFDDKVVILDFSHDIVAIIIENSSIYRAQKAQFELAWQQATTPVL